MKESMSVEGGNSMKFIAFFLAFAGSVVMYSTHVHQGLFTQPLPKYFRWIGSGCIFIALVMLCVSLPKLVAVFMWLITMLMVWSFLPFFPHLKYKQ